MLAHLEARLPRCSGDQGSDVASLELSHLAARDAHDMMAIDQCRRRETFAVAGQVHPADRPYALEYLEGAIHGGQTELRTPPTSFGMDLGGGHATRGGRHDLEDGPTLPGLLEAMATQCLCRHCQIHDGLSCTSSTLTLASRSQMKMISIYAATLAEPPDTGNDRIKLHKWSHSLQVAATAPARYSVRHTQLSRLREGKMR